MAKYGLEPEIMNARIQDFGRLCSNRKVVVRCLFERRIIHGRERRFPCSACPKNKRDKRWADYIAKDLIMDEKKKIITENTLSLRDEINKEKAFYKKVADFQRIIHA